MCAARRRFLGLVGAVLVGVAAVLAGACAPSPAPSLIRISHPTTLVGTAWRLVSIEGRQPPAGPDLTISFGPTDVSGDGPCNSFGGTYAYDSTNGALGIGGLVSTKRACLEAVRNELEAAYFGALGGVAAASRDEDGRLVLSGSGAELVFAVGPQQAGPAVDAPPSATP